MDSLFDDRAEGALARGAPLAIRMRPRTLDEFVGQEDVLGEGRMLRQAIERDELTSLILFGPAGTGKTSLARIIAKTTEAHFSEVSAVTSGVADIRREIAAARERLGMSDRGTILFVDEIHRFSKSQQDALLHAVEDGLLVLVGATTENPMFEVNPPLLSRSRVVEFYPLGDEEIRRVLHSALDDERGFGGAARLEPEAEDLIVLTAGGDARSALMTLEMSVASASSVDGVAVISRTCIQDANPTRQLPYDKSGDSHYDVVSAFIKSMRGSDPDAAVYWLARMVHGGEDPKFIARRILIFASEDVGNADPRALLIAHSAVKAAEFIGWPECRINLSQAAIYMALAPKSNASYVAIDRALDEVTSGPRRDVPSHLRDRHRPGSGEYDAYLYPHAYAGGVVPQRYLPDGLETGDIYTPGELGWEADGSVRSDDEDTLA